MDPARFDSLTRSAANRREVVSKFGVGGLAAALAAGLGVRRASAQTVACSLDLRASVRLGPSAGTPLIPAATQMGSIEGTLQLAIAGDGSLESAAFVLADGTSLPVAGQAIGHRLSVRIAMDADRTLVLQGVAQDPLRTCQGQIDGSLIVPAEGDLGDFHAELTGAVTGIPTEAAINSATTTLEGPTAPALAPTSAPDVPSPTPSPTAVCLPFGPAEVCVFGICGQHNDGCGGVIDCGNAACAADAVCVRGSCCVGSSAATVCGDDRMCGFWINECDLDVDCGGCEGGFTCVDRYCCGAPGIGCLVGGDCCSGSCSMLNGCN